MSNTPLFVEEILPSRECTECPKAACLEFTVVDYWGDPVDSPTQFTLDGKPVSPNCKIKTLQWGNHILKAIGGEEVREAIINRPYIPKKLEKSPAVRKAGRERAMFHSTDDDQLWKGISLRAGCLSTLEPCDCYKHIIEIGKNVDYCILMAFMDNHSGGIHGTGHAGAIIVDGKQGQWLYTDFGPYENDLGTVRNYLGLTILIDKNSGKIDEIALGEALKYLNKHYGSNIVSSKPCNAHDVLNGPDHENFGVGNISVGFEINGIIAWALFALPGGAYKRMYTYANQKKYEMEAKRAANISGYKNTYNCMTYAVSVLNSGLGKPAPSETGEIFDHPNAHIRSYMDKAHEQGYFDHRMFNGAAEAVSKRPQQATLGVRHRESVCGAVCTVEHAKPYKNWQYR